MHEYFQNDFTRAWLILEKKQRENRDKRMTGLFSSNGFGQHPPGNPPWVFRSQSTVSCVEKFSGDGWKMVIVKTPPVVGINATSPRSVLKVESSSWANYHMERR
jgi:hypothetical protein